MYLGLTQTEAGRDYLRQEIEARFAESFTGRVTIETVSGNLQRRIHLQNVAFYDEKGVAWLHIDEITALPNWKTVIGWRLELNSLEIVRPSLSVRYHADSTWNLASILKGRTPNPTLKNWEFGSAHISVSGGVIDISYEDHAPDVIQSRWLFDLSEAEIFNLSMEGELNLESGRRFLAIESFQTSIDTLTVEMDGELVLEHDLIHVNSLNLSSSTNHATIIGVLSSRSDRIDISLIKSRITPTFAHAIIPHLSLPDSLSVSGQVHRKDSHWTVQDVIAFSDHSQITIPTAEFQTSMDQVSFEASVATSVLDPADLQGIPWKGEAVQIQGNLQGRRSNDEFVLSGELDFATKTGSYGYLHGSVQHDTKWSYEANMDVNTLNLSDFTDTQTWTGVLHGQLSVKGEGIQSPSASGSLSLHPSTIGKHALDSLQIEGTITGRQLHLSGFASKQDAHTTLEIATDWNHDMITYEGKGYLTSFDLGPLLEIPELKTSIHADWILRGAGTNLDEISAFMELSTDSSTVTWKGIHHLADPTRWFIDLHDITTARPRLTVGGDIIDLTVSGKLHQNSVHETWRTWQRAFSRIVGQFAAHLRETPYTTPSESETPQKIESVPTSPVELKLSWKLHDHPAMNALFPMLSKFSSGGQGRTDILASSDTLNIQFHFQDEAFHLNNVSLYQGKAVLTLAANGNEPIESGWKLGLDLSADSLSDSHITIHHPRLTINQDGKTGSLDIYTGRGSSQRYLLSGIQLFRDRTQIQVRDVHIPIRNTVWSISHPTNIDLFSDAAVMEPLRLQTVNPLLGEVEIIAIQGSLSSLPTDTLSLTLDGVNLNHLPGILGLRRDLGGQVDADLSWTGLWQPEITGKLTVDTLTFDQYLIGRVQASSILLPEQDGLNIDLAIDSIGSAPAGYRYANNQIHVHGNILANGSSAVDTLGIDVDVQRLDASFLQLILPEFTGFGGGFDGELQLTGPLSNPVFGGSLTWGEGRFGIPKFNSSYEASASVTLVEDQIHVDQLNVQDSDGGKAMIQGILDLNAFRYLSFDASADFDSLQIMNILSHHSSDLAFYGDIRVSGSATLTGPVHTAFLRSNNLIITPQSNLYIPVRESDTEHDPGFIIYVDPMRPIERQLTSFRRRGNILDERPRGERLFGDGLDMDINLVGPPGSKIHLVIDPLLGDVISGVGTARLQMQRTGGEIATYGFFEFSSGDYLFTAGDVFVRRFLIDSGTITWNGDPLNPALNIQGAYRTRASRNGLPDDVGGTIKTSLPLIVQLNVSGTLNAVQIDLELEIDQRQEVISDTPLLDSYLNRPDLAAEHATSVLLTNSFLLSTDGTRSEILASSAVNSVSSLVASRLNRYLSQVVPQADLRFGVQSDETVQDMDVSADIALRLLNERLVIRGQGVYRALNTEQIAPQGLEGEFTVEIQLSPSVAVEFFYRREGDVLSESLITKETGIGINYRTDFTSWRQLFGQEKDDAKGNTQTDGSPAE